MVAVRPDKDALGQEWNKLTTSDCHCMFPMLAEKAGLSSIKEKMAEAHFHTSRYLASGSSAALFEDKNHGSLAIRIDSTRWPTLSDKDCPAILPSRGKIEVPFSALTGPEVVVVTHVLKAEPVARPHQINDRFDLSDVKKAIEDAGVDADKKTSLDAVCLAMGTLDPSVKPEGRKISYDAIEQILESFYNTIETPERTVDAGKLEQAFSRVASENLKVGIDDIYRTLSIFKSSGALDALQDLHEDQFCHVRDGMGQLITYSDGRPLTPIWDLNATNLDVNQRLALGVDLSDPDRTPAEKKGRLLQDRLLKQKGEVVTAAQAYERIPEATPADMQAYRQLGHFMDVVMAQSQLRERFNLPMQAGHVSHFIGHNANRLAHGFIAMVQQQESKSSQNLPPSL